MNNLSASKHVMLVADDQAPDYETLQNYLKKSNFELTFVSNAIDAPELLLLARPDLLLIDLDSIGSEIDNNEFYLSIRSGSAIPILLLTTNVEQATRLIDGGISVDDYLSKPFSPQKVLARIHAMFEYLDSQREAGNVIFIGDIMIDIKGNLVERANQNIALSRTGFKILVLLAQHPRRVFSRAQIIEALKGNHLFLRERTVDAHIKNLRSKIESNPQQPKCIHTVFGFGYKFEL
jgi:DNA-binding response OmpR family regulator